MRKPRGKTWEVEIAPRAWEQLGVVPGDVFRSLQKELDRIASGLTSGDSAKDEALGPVIAGGYQAHCVLDTDAQLVVLQKVTRRPASDEGKDELTSTGKRKRRS